MSDSSSDQFLKIFRDENKKDLFGWLNTYLNPKPTLLTEQWLFTAKADMKLYGCTFCFDPIMDNIPTNDKEWIASVEAGPKFEAHVKGIAETAAYTPQYVAENPEICAFVGTSYYCIYNGDDNQNRGELVQITLTGDSHEHGHEHHEHGAEKYKQISLMKTLEAQKPWFIVSHKHELKKPITFGEFITNGGVAESKFAPEEIGFVNFENMTAEKKSPV